METIEPSTLHVECLDVAGQTVGGITKLARALGVGQSNLSNWKRRGRIPVEFHAQIEEFSGGKYTRRDLRPKDWHKIWPELVDLYGRPASVTPAATPGAAVVGEGA